jgi:spermidine synthase
MLTILSAATGIILCLSPQAASSKRRAPIAFIGAATAIAVVVLMSSRQVFVDPGEVRIRQAGVIYRTAEDEIASVQAGAVNGNKQLFVNGNGMTLLTVDTKLMPILPLALRPNSTTALVIAFGMGSAFRMSLLAGLRTEGVDLVPSVPGMFDVFYPDAPMYLNNPKAKVVIADGRNFVALTKQKYDIIIVDPPPPVQSAGVSIISSLEFYQAGHDRLSPGGVMMQWTTLGQTVDDFRAHVRSFRKVFPNVIVARGPAGWGFYMLGSDQPLSLDSKSLAAILSRTGVTEDLSSAFDSPQHTLQGWLDLIPRLILLSGPDVDRFAGQGPLITDDHPLPEYFLLRLLFGRESPELTGNEVRVAAKLP